MGLNKRLISQADGIIESVVGTPNFEVIKYTGNGSSSNSITGVGFAPDFIWVKKRGTGNWYMSNTIRGANQYVQSNTNNSEATDSNIISSFDSDGFTVGSSTEVNQSSTDYMAFCWGATNVTTTIPSGTNGTTISSDVRATPNAGFSIVSYTGDGGSATKVGHGLSSAPEIMFIKNLTNSTDWSVYSNQIYNTPNTHLKLGSSAAWAFGNDFGNTAPTSDWFEVGSENRTNQLNSDYIAYCFHSVSGYVKHGKYNGGSTGSGNTINVGFQPKWIMFKLINGGTGAWMIHDSVRGFTYYLNAGSTTGNEGPDLVFTVVSNGFYFNYTYGDWNASGDEYMYLAFA